MSASAEAPEILFRHHLKKLKLPTVLREHEKLARQCANEGVDHVRYRARLIGLELLDRDRDARRGPSQRRSKLERPSRMPR